MSSRSVCLSSRWSLLLLLAACLRFGGAQDESLPPSLVDLVMNSPISSMQDLQRLLDAESVGKADPLSCSLQISAHHRRGAEEEEDEVHSNSTHKRLPRSLVGVQVAQQAMCKVRTEVMEVTRAMLDRRNANFLLWPLCVEVQRCSGCCNTRTLQCVPVTTETRNLQMTKIQFINRQPVYEKVIIPVEDHVSCSCQSRAAAQAPRAKATPPPPPPRLPPKAVPPKTQSKEELHRHDDLKQNQRFHLEDRETQEAQWQSKYTLTHTEGAPAHTLTHTQGYRPGPARHTLTHTPAGPSYGSPEELSTRRTTLGVPHMLSDTTQHFPVQEGITEHQTHPDGVKEHHTKITAHRIHHLGSGDGHVRVQQQPTEHHHHRHHETTHRPTHDSSHHHSQPQPEITLQHSGQLEAPILSYSHVEVIGQSSGHTELPDHHSGQSATLSQSEAAKHHHSQSDQGEKHRDGLEQQSRHGHHHHPHHHQQQHHPTQATILPERSTARAVMNAPPTTPPAPQTPPPLVPQRRRRRKHRRRISKSAMRAMIIPSSVDTGRCPTGRCPQDAATGRCPTGCCPQDAATGRCPTGRCPQDAATGHCPQDGAPQDGAPQDAATQEGAHRTLPHRRVPTGRCHTGGCSQDAAPRDGGHRMVPTGHCSQDAATGRCHRTLPQDAVTGRCHRTLPQDTAYRTLLTGRCSQDTAYRTLPTGRCPTGCCPQDAAHRTLPTGRCPQDAAHRTLPSGCYWVDSIGWWMILGPEVYSSTEVSLHHHVSVTAVLRMIHHPHHTCSVVVLWGS
ncbi:hypothetical protein NFI96_006158 [Prochilodus magdalenae]|nr:hypothetical protein NFI96_006158 [Prochilodus magdalenae]